MRPHEEHARSLPGYATPSIIFQHPRQSAPTHPLSPAPSGEMKMDFFFPGVSGILLYSPSALRMVENHVAQVLEHQLAAELESVLFGMLLWGAAGAVVAVVLAGAARLVWSRILREKKMSTLLEQLEKNQGRIEASTSLVRGRINTPKKRRAKPP